MKKILLILMLFTPIITWGQKSDLIKFLDACKTFEFEESKEIISKYSFNLGNMYDLLNYEEPTDILFDTDTLNIKGYKATINCKIKNKAGQYIDKKMIVVMYLNKENSLWCVEMFREATDPNKEYKISKQDVDSGKFYTKKQYVYRNLAYWAISSGKLNEAIKYMNIAEEEAAKVNDTKFNIDSQKEVLRKII